MAGRKNWAVKLNKYSENKKGGKLLSISCMLKRSTCYAFELDKTYLDNDWSRNWIEKLNKHVCYSTGKLGEKVAKKKKGRKLLSISCMLKDR